MPGRRRAHGSARADGSAAVVVKSANGFYSPLPFTGNEFLRGSAALSGAWTDPEWSLSAGVCHVRVDDQRFEVPEALVKVDWADQPPGVSL